MKNREATKRRLLDSVGHIIKNHGFGGLGVNKVARGAHASKVLIYRYFGSFDKLVLAYVREKDFWVNYSPVNQDEIDTNAPLEEQISQLINDEFTHFYNHCEIEAALLTELRNNSGIMNDIHHRDLLKDISNDAGARRQEMLQGKDDKNKEPFKYFNIVSALLIAGTHQLYLQKIDNSEDNAPAEDVEPQTKLRQSIKQIVQWTFGR